MLIGPRKAEAYIAVLAVRAVAVPVAHLQVARVVAVASAPYHTEEAARRSSIII